MPSDGIESEPFFWEGDATKHFSVTWRTFRIFFIFFCSRGEEGSEAGGGGFY